MGLVGRDPEQQVVAGLVEKARGGRSGVLALVGEPGMGKSALLEYAVQQASGMNLLRARGVQSESHIPFAGLSELLRPALALLDRIPAPQAAALEGALALTPTRSEERFAVGAATLSLLAAWAEPRPALVVVDDTHWIDGSSADALSFAFRRLMADPIAVVIAVRDGEPSLLDGSDLPRLRLCGLDLSAASALITGAAGPVPEDVIERVHRHSGGNPLALLEAARQIDHFRQGVPLEMPLPIVTRVSQVYLARARALPVAATVLLLAAASDLSDVATLARAAPALGLDISALAAAESGGLVDLRQGRVEFRHPLIRSAVYGDADPSFEDKSMGPWPTHCQIPTPTAGPGTWRSPPWGPTTLPARRSNKRPAGRGTATLYDVAAHAFERSARSWPPTTPSGPPSLRRGRRGMVRRPGHPGQDVLDQAGQHTAAADLAISIGHLRGHIAARVGPVGEALSGSSLLRPSEQRQRSRSEP